MGEMYEYSGEVWIERSGENAGGLMRLPWVVYGDIELPLTFEQLQEIAYNIGTDFLSMLSGSDPTHREDYGNIVGFEIISIVPVIR